MIEPGSRVEVRSVEGQSTGRVTRREFDPWSREWLYDVVLASGQPVRVPFLALIEVTEAGDENAA